MHLINQVFMRNIIQKVSKIDTASSRFGPDT